MRLPQHRLWLLREIAQEAAHYRHSVHASPIQNTPSRALAQMYATPYCPLSRSSCFFAMTLPTSRAPYVESISVPCLLRVRVQRRYVWHCAYGEWK